MQQALKYPDLNIKNMCVCVCVYVCLSINNYWENPKGYQAIS